MNTPTIVLASLLVLSMVAGLCGCATRGKALRPTGGKKGDPETSGPDKVALADAWYIQSTAKAGAKPYSCSFVEFDERGDYLDFQQHKHSWEKIKALSKELAGGDQEKLLVIIYCHGWKNNSQSGDVLSFNHFLSRLADSPTIQAKKLRVHGVYLSWRGNSYQHAIDEDSAEFSQTKTDFGDRIVNPIYQRRFRYGLLWLPEMLSYWSRKGAAESKVSGVPMARTIFTCAQAAKHYSPPGITNQVFVIGHSFGALMLEKSLGQACVGSLASNWPWDWDVAAPAAVASGKASAAANFLPFDCILFVNSAAPSIHSKLLSDFLWAHKRAMIRDDNLAKAADAPVIISITSTADWATKVVHPIGNLLAGFRPSLWRDYTNGVLKHHTNSTGRLIKIPQYYFYRRTPGHNPLLVDHWITPVKAGDTTEAAPSGTPAQVLEHNLNLETKFPAVFYTSAGVAKAGGPAPAAGWHVDPKPWPQDEQWHLYQGQEPVKRGDYWIIRCDRSLIKGHNDVWSSATMELYMALYRMAEVERQR